jgi:hypothetical protein
MSARAKSQATMSMSTAIRERQETIQENRKQTSDVRAPFCTGSGCSALHLFCELVRTVIWHPAQFKSIS